MSFSRRFAARCAGAGLGIALIAAACVSAPAQASTAWPGPVTGVHVASRTTTSFTVALDRAVNTSWYRVNASTVESDIWLSNIDKSSSHRVVTGAANPSITVGKLANTPDSYYYRVATINGSHVRWSSYYHSVHLLPPAPTSLAAHSGAAGAYLTWSASPATGFTIDQATDSAFTQQRRSYTISEDARQFTPYDLIRGQRYFFRVRAVNGGAASSVTAPVQLVPTTSVQTLRMLTYNTLSTVFDGTKTGSGTIQPPWSQRRPGDLNLLREANADLITVQEAGAYVDAAHTQRQVDSIASGLGSAYGIANTNHGSNPGALQNSPFTNNYILYRKAALMPVGTGGHWMIGYDHNACYQLLRTSAGAAFLFVGTHLDSTRGSLYDYHRKVQTDNMIALATQYARSQGVTSIVYGGDMNSWPGRFQTTDTPGIEMRKNATSDALPTAQTQYNARFSSINSYFRTPPLGGSADRLFVTPGVAVTTWSEWLDLANGQFTGVIPSDHNPVLSIVQLPS